MVRKAAKTTMVFLAILCLLTGTGLGQDRTQPSPSNGKAPDLQTDRPPQTDILDIKPPRDLPPGPFPWLIVLSLVLVLLLVLAAVYYFRRKRKEKQIPPRPPHETAMLRLDRLETAGLPARAFYFRLSEIWRCYLEARFDLGALAMTSDELVPAMDALDIDPSLQASLKVLARESDPVKYAGAGADDEKMKQDLSLVRFFVSRTATAPENDA